MLVQVNQAPSISNAGSDQAYCSSAGSQSATLLGSNPDVGNGTWTQVSGPAPASIVYPNSSNSPVSNMQKGVYTFRWSIASDACAVSVDDIQVTVGVSSIAGSNQQLCNATAATLQGNTPTPGIGNWTQVSGPAVTINDPANPVSTINGLSSGNTYVLAWRIVNGTCTNSTQVTITNYTAPFANAGPNQSFSNASSATLHGNTPTAGTGAWTQTSGPAATISAPANPGTGVSGLIPGNAYVFTWTVSNGSCAPASAQTTLTNVLNTMANAGPDQSVSDVNQFTLNGNSPDQGNTGQWTILSSPSGSSPVITQPNQPVTTVTMVNRPGDYLFNWNITSNGFSTSDEVKVTVLSILPVKLISFTGMQEDDHVILKWETSAEDNNDHFDLERSIDGREFVKIGTVAGNGNASTIKHYIFLDGLNGVSQAILYYRLVQVDKNGRFGYSGIVKLVVNAVAGIGAWPNPVNARVNVTAYFNSAGTAQIDLYDYAGKRILRLRQAVVKGYNTIVLDHLQQVRPGLIILEVRKETMRKRIKLIKE